MAQAAGEQSLVGADQAFELDIQPAGEPALLLVVPVTPGTHHGAQVRANHAGDDDRPGQGQGKLAEQRPVSRR